MSADNSSTTTLVNTRLQSVDLLRGAVMVLMAIDHVRVYAGISPGGPDPAIFFTRWITHFCAPAFVFFAGTSAFLYGIKLNNKRKLASYLITRGILLVVLELTFIRFCWTFNLDYSKFLLAGVIWMLGWCMILLAAFAWLRPLVAGCTGLFIIAAQQLFSFVPKALPSSSRQSFGYFWEFIYTSGLEAPPGITILYVLVPWIGVMLAGYGFGAILLMDAAKRKRICRWIGLSAIFLFIIIGSIMAARQESKPGSLPFILRLLNQKKYPASQLYLLMTLGPVIALVPFAEKVKGWFANVLIIFGKVPMFYYLLHIPLIHLTAFVVNLLCYGQIHQDWYNTAPYVWIESGDNWGLPLLYLVFLVDVIILYFACRWYAAYKSNHPEKKWTKYI
jgi:uncharacterized membrane protein